MLLVGKVDCSLEILLPKKERKLDASDEADDNVGSEGCADFESRVLRVYQSLRG